ncbi:hypothetical protein ABE137_12350 [Brevibacillus laterosporus]|uniref:hypothetical protein n=1 Tax=Brevibacillus phage Sundance TaxID=1691958 RepID=UPI0006BE1765|nr:hypothetical protein AVT09_gp145 [Brevibacillus phage Sundance]ALA47961.1 hypothetical protein SUNDANCE_145 [Brevibacillus phage Sundance]
MEVAKDIHSMFLNWAYDNISGFHSHVVTVADSVVWRDENGEVLASVYLYGGEKYYIKKSALDMWSGK